MECGFYTKISAPKKHKCQQCSASQHPEKKLTVTTSAARVVNSEIVKSSFTTWHTYRCAPELVTAIWFFPVGGRGWGVGNSCIDGQVTTQFGIGSIVCGLVGVEEGDSSGYLQLLTLHFLRTGYGLVHRLSAQVLIKEPIAQNYLSCFQQRINLQKCNFCSETALTRIWRCLYWSITRRELQVLVQMVDLLVKWDRVKSCVHRIL